VTEAHVDDGPVVRLDLRLARTLVAYLTPFRHERGGVLLGQRLAGTVLIGGAVFPPQLARAHDYCAFDVQGIEVIRRAVSALTDPGLARVVGTIVGWVHSHPGYGLFMSSTDVETLESWTHLDDRAVAVVVDPLLPGQPERRIAWWDRRGNGQPVAIGGSEAEELGLPGASSLAQTLNDNATSTAPWDIVTSRCIISVFPALSEAGDRPTEMRGERW
jgi:hypothetical protein